MTLHKNLCLIKYELWRMSKPEMGSIFNIKNQRNILVIGNYYVNYQNYQNLMLLSSSARILNEHWCIYSCLQIPPRENWFHHVRRVYAAAFIFPCILTLTLYKCTVLDTNRDVHNPPPYQFYYRVVRVYIWGDYEIGLNSSASFLYVPNPRRKEILVKIR